MKGFEPDIVERTAWLSPKTLVGIGEKGEVFFSQFMSCDICSYAIRNIQMFKTPLRHTIYISCCKIQRKRKKCKRNKQVCKAELFASRTINTPLHAKT